MAEGQDFQSMHMFDKIVIDPGHGGYDSGARGSKSKEKHITLAIGLMTGELIRKNLPDVEVIYTRTDDEFVELHRRAKIANENAADLFISIHCNSNTSSKPYGAETYVMGLHKTQENLEVAKAENAAILMEEDYDEQYGGFNPNLDEDYIMLNMFQSANIQQSLDFSLVAQNKLSSVGGMHNRGVRQAGFVVLYLTTMPGVLIETGFLSNAAEEEYLMKKENQQRIAQSIYEAVADYKRSREIQKVKIPEPEPDDSAQAKPEPVKTFRLWFAAFNHVKDPDHRKFRSMPDLWHFAYGGKYQYTYGKSNSLSGIVELLNRLRQEDKIRRKYLKDVKIIEFDGSRLISDPAVLQD
ncbi:MAG: N-acetylmuramoyl-L-alanine amidase [Bacteroidales bacterium]